MHVTISSWILAKQYFVNGRGPLVVNSGSRWSHIFHNIRGVKWWQCVGLEGYLGEWFFIWYLVTSFVRCWEWVSKCCHCFYGTYHLALISLGVLCDFTFSPNASDKWVWSVLMLVMSGYGLFIHWLFSHASAFWVESIIIKAPDISPSWKHLESSYA